MPVAVGVMADSYNKPAAATGPPVTSGLAGWYDASQLAGANGSRVTAWPDLSGAGRNLTGPGPTLTVSGLNGKSVATYDRNLDMSLTAPMPPFRQFFIVARYDGATFVNYDGLLTESTTLVVLIGGAASTEFWTGSSIEAYYKDGILYPQPWPAPIQAWAVLSGSRDASWVVADIMIGCDRSISGRWWDGGIAEVIVYDRVLTTVERQQVEQYLKGKWGTP